MSYQPHENILIISDVHGNFEMLEKVLAWADAHDIHHIWNLGDVYGYRSGEEADKCWEILRSRARVNIMGNHDLFAAQGQELVELHSQVSSLPDKEYQEELAYLRGWERLNINGWEIFLCHASPVDVFWEFISSVEDAQLAWAHASKSDPAPDMIIVGHTHRPALYGHLHGQDIFVDESMEQMRVDVRRDAKIIANPGSLGASDKRGYFAVLKLNELGEPGSLRWYRLR